MNRIQYLAIVDGKPYRLMRSPGLYRDGLPKDAIIIPVYGCNIQQLPRGYTEPVKHYLTWIDEELPPDAPHNHITGWHEDVEIPVWTPPEQE